MPSLVTTGKYSARSNAWICWVGTHDIPTVGRPAEWWIAETLVPGGGVEPPRAEARRILSPLRLPVPPSRLYLQVLDFTKCL